ncbi:MAG: RNA-binding transcriptional accessory protein [Clostridium sp.]|jgi:uncharacterized protein|nr:RNA-binding transcriptional accessory protein [Clostridium sp.]
MDILQQLKEELNVGKWQVEAAVKLMDEGNTIPFLSRYRKEATGALNDEQLRDLAERLNYLRGLEEKKAQVLGSLEEQGKLTEELKRKIQEAPTLVVVDDLYRPYRPKRKTRASVAREKGLEGLARFILEQNTRLPLEEEAAKYLSEEKEITLVTDALQGAKDILAENISDEADDRLFIRNATMAEGTISSAARNGGKGVSQEAGDGKREGKDASKEKLKSGVYEMYYQFEELLKKIAGHRVLALNRGEAEKILTVRLNPPVERILRFLETKLITRDNPFTVPVLKEVVQDSYERLIAPAIEREIRNELTEKAQDGAIAVFGKNLAQLLLQPPVAGKVVLGWDPAFRTGCKLAVVDPTGKVLDTTVIFPTAPQNKVKESKAELKQLIRRHRVDLISLGNGTASRESEQVITELLKELDRPVSYVIVNEAGASVYSASKLATEEFPGLDVGQRSAVSIARRLQDPLAELVKIDPKSIGVGQYQHDMNQKKLGQALNGVVEDSVNKVGVDLNTASVSLLGYVSGLSKAVAKNIVEYREANGRFRSRRQLLEVAKLGPKAFEQCAGFLRVSDGENPLDATGIHPESYEAARKLLDRLGLTMADVREAQKKAAGAKTAGGRTTSANTAGGQAAVSLERRIPSRKRLAEELGIGEITLSDILKELEKPARDPRDDMPGPILRSDVLEMKDLKPGMVLKGTVRNVIDFGAFVDIGVHQDGLVHISQMTERFIRHPLEAVSVGDIVEVQVLEVDTAKKRIALTMKKR